MMAGNGEGEMKRDKSEKTDGNEKPKKEDIRKQQREESIHTPNG